MTKIKEVDLYCYTEARVLGIGIVGPKHAVKVTKNLATQLIKDGPDTWSLTPFEIKETEENNEDNEE